MMPSILKKLNMYLLSMANVVVKNCSLLMVKIAMRAIIELWEWSDAKGNAHSILKRI